MAENHDEIGFREMDNKFLLVTDIDSKTKMIIKRSGYRIRSDDNAMLVFGYIDQEAGISFELLCAACVYDDGDVSLEPINKSTSFKFRYGSFQGNLIPFNNYDQLFPYQDRAMKIVERYAVSDEIREIRAIEDLDSSRAPGFPDDLAVFFIKEDGYERIWCRTMGIDRERKVVQMKMLNEPYSAFGKHIGDIVDVTLIRTKNGDVVPTLYYVNT